MRAELGCIVPFPLKADWLTVERMYVVGDGILRKIRSRNYKMNSATLLRIADAIASSKFSVPYYRMRSLDY
jgi:hypothetical protein